MWKEVNLLSTNFSAKHTPSATLRNGVQTTLFPSGLLDFCYQQQWPGLNIFALVKFCWIENWMKSKDIYLR